MNGRVAGARFRLARLAAACPPPPALLDAVRLLGAEAPWLSLKGAHQALHLADLSHGGAGVDCVVALAELWGLQADGHGLRPDPVQRGELEALAADVRAVGAAPAPCHLGWSDELHLAEAGIVVEAGNLVARQDTRSAMARALRRQLAAVGSLTPAELLAGLLRSGLLREGVLRRRVDLAGLTEMTVTAWAAQQHDIELDSSTGGDRLGLAGPSARWLRPSDPCVLALLERSDIVTRQDVVAALTAHGHRTGSASVWLVRCPWLRPAGSRGQHRRAGSMSLAPRHSVNVGGGVQPS